MTARQVIIDALTAQTGAGQPLENVNVLGYARSIDPPAKPTVLVRVDLIEPHPKVPSRNLYTFALVLVPTKAEPGPADDELDGLLEDVLYAVDKAPDLTWTRAQRGTFQDTTYPAYEVTLAVPILKESTA